MQLCIYAHRFASASRAHFVDLGGKLEIYWVPLARRLDGGSRKYPRGERGLMNWNYRIEIQAGEFVVVVFCN